MKDSRPTLWDVATFLLAEMDKLCGELETLGETARAAELREYVETHRKLLVRWPPGRR